MFHEFQVIHLYLYLLDWPKSSLEYMGEGEGRTKGESSMETYMLPFIKQTAGGNLLYNTGSSTRCSVKTSRGGSKVQEGGTYVYLWLIYVDVWQKPTQHCKVIILQWKINCLKKKILRIVPCAIQEVIVVYLFYIHQCVYVNPKVPVYLCSLPPEVNCHLAGHTGWVCAVYKCRTRKQVCQPRKTACEAVKRDPVLDPRERLAGFLFPRAICLHARFWCSQSDTALLPLPGGRMCLCSPLGMQDRLWMKSSLF